jgi:hypothetical protein
MRASEQLCPFPDTLSALGAGLLGPLLHECPQWVESGHSPDGHSILTWISHSPRMRKPPSHYSTEPRHPVSDHPELAEVLRALASVTREEGMRKRLKSLAEAEENKSGKGD